GIDRCVVYHDQPRRLPVDPILDLHVHLDLRVVNPLEQILAGLQEIEQLDFFSRAGFPFDQPRDHHQALEWGLDRPLDAFRMLIVQQYSPSIEDGTLWNRLITGPMGSPSLVGNELGPFTLCLCESGQSWSERVDQALYTSVGSCLLPGRQGFKGL